MTILYSTRLRLEPFALAHLDGLSAMNSDPEVMRYVLGHPEARAETQAIIERVLPRWAAGGPSWWSFIELSCGELIGAGCIQHLRRSGSIPDPDCPWEIGWRLRRDRWNQGFASEAARVMARFAFDTLKPDVLMAVCEPANVASMKVMRKLGMQFRGIESWYGRELAAYAITAKEWAEQNAKGASGHGT
jgi:RimJ/RimL family protein N-acetyltransferase